MKLLSGIEDNHMIRISNEGNISDVHNTESSYLAVNKLKEFYNTISSNISNIKLLMQRALVAYWRCGDSSIKNDLLAALEGLRKLRSNYVKNTSLQIAYDIDHIHEYVSNSLAKIEIKGFSIPKNLERFKMMNLFEASATNFDHMKVAPKKVLEGVDYNNERIKEFLFFEEESLKNEDKDFMVQILAALNKAEKNYNYITKSDVKENCARLISPTLKQANPSLNERELWWLAVDEATIQLDRKVAIKKLEDLDSMPSNLQAQIGLILPMNFGWDTDRNQAVGHAFYLSVCKDVIGTYTVSQANAGGLGLGKYISFFNNNRHVIVEFKHINEESIIEFLIEADRVKEEFFDDFDAAGEAYNNLFDLLESNPVTDGIPPRRAQVAIGNCVIRSLKESLIHAFQKSNKIDL
ncbi:MAG TPA: hypothetical protein VGP47_07865, partial [Parachlamydiaceae bacterium]|nr:hypothetical protein [Parachlamydiaceae bacterium]